ERNLFGARLLAGIHWHGFIVAAFHRRRRRPRRLSHSRPRGASAAAFAVVSTTVRTAFEELEVIGHDVQPRTLLTVLGRPLIEFEMPFNEYLVPLSEALLDEIGLPASLSPIEHVNV